MTIKHLYPDAWPTLNLDFANQLALDPRITFTRSSIGTYVDKNGIMQIAQDDEPRFDHDPVTGESLGLLIEESRTNFEPYSDLSTGWSFMPAQGSNSTAPDGSNNAVELNGGNAGGTGNIIVTKNITLTTAGAYVLSFFVKKPADSIAAFTYLEARSFSGSSSGGKLFFDWSTNDWSSWTQDNGSAYILPVKEYANGWFRLSIKLTLVSSDLSGSIRTGISDQAGNASTGTFSTVNKILVWGAQLEEGPYPTSYIPTAGSTVTKAVDLATIRGNQWLDIWTSNNQSIFAEGTINYTVDYTTYPVNLTGPNLYRMDGQSSIAKVWYSYVENTYRGTVDGSSGGGGTVDLFHAVTQKTGTFKSCLTLDTNNDRIISAWNTVLSNKDDGANYIINTYRQGNYPGITIGGAASNERGAWNGTVARIAIYNVAMPNEQLQALTA